MNLKAITLSAAMSAILMAASPMISTSMSTDNGGTKKAIDAYSDGAGVLLINQASDTKFDNSAMNKLVFKYGDAAKSSNTTLKNQINVLSLGATAIEKAAATTSLETAKLVINPPVNGTACDDGSSSTANDVWMNSVCAGVNNDGVVCDDGQAFTYNDKYTSGVCGGTLAVSCKQIKAMLPASVDGVYGIDTDGNGGLSPFNVYCDMTTDGGGWTLVANVSTSNKNHYGTTTDTNLATTGAIVPLDYAGRKLNDAAVRNLLNSGVGLFRAHVNNKSYTVFHKISNNNAFSFAATGGATAPYRTWIAYTSALAWQADDLTNGYLWGCSSDYAVFDSHNVVPTWYASGYNGNRLLWGYAGRNGIYWDAVTNVNGLMWIK